jgi:hypothetical protein
VHSPIFGRVLASSGFAVGGGAGGGRGRSTPLFAALEELGARLSTPPPNCAAARCPARAGWTMKRESPCGFRRPLADSDEAELGHPRKQRAEVRKGLAGD